MRILIVDFEFPEPDRSSGGHRLHEIVKILVSEHEVAFLSWDYWWKWHDQDPKYEKALNEMGVSTRFVKNAAIDGQTGEFIEDFVPDVVVLSKYYIANIFYPYLSMAMPMCRTILDTVDVHFVRERRQREATGSGGDYRETEIQERSAARMVDRVWVVTPSDAEHIGGEGVAPVVVPNIHPELGEVPGRAGRSGVVFVGNYIHQPNQDAVLHLATAILPQLGVDEPVRVAGAAMEQLRHRYEGIEYLGWQDDLDGFLSSSLVGVAPLRYGAGMKGKIGDYMANGLPVVTTAVGAEGMGLTNGEDAFIVDDPSGFAESVRRLCCDEELWGRFSANGLGRVACWSPASVRERVLTAVEF
jgi:glycosyltransferase involved in cell wall biosynthesis